MEVGRRVLTPEAFGFERKCVEMRKIGPHPSALPYAVILGFLDQAPVYASNIFKPVMATLGLNNFFNSWGKELTSVAIESTQFAEEFEQKCNEFLDYYTIPRETDGRFENIQMLLEKLRISVSLNLGEFACTFGEQSTQFTLYIGVHQRVCFLLYRNLSRESFVILPCGHLQLRYRLMANLQRAARNQAISSADRIEPICCSDCDASYTSEILGFAESLARGEYILTLPQSPQPTSLVCVLCNREITMQDLAFCCECSNTVCMQCMAISRLTMAMWACPVCNERRKPDAHFDYCISQSRNLEPYFADKFVKSQPKYELQKRKKCAKCSTAYDIRDYLSIEEHVNCWVCKVCITRQIRAGESCCIRCNHEYRKMLQEEEKVSDEKSHLEIEGHNPIALTTKGQKHKDVISVKTDKRIMNCCKCQRTGFATTFHLCSENRAYCYDCCLYEVIITCTQDAYKCSICSTSFTNLDVDMNVKKYRCITCGKNKNLKEISHKCKNEEYFCWKCIHIENDGMISCRTCGSSHTDKYSHQRGSIKQQGKNRR